MPVRVSMSTENHKSTVTNFPPSSSHCKESAPHWNAAATQVQNACLQRYWIW